MTARASTSSTAPPGRAGALSDTGLEMHSVIGRAGEEIPGQAARAAPVRREAAGLGNAAPPLAPSRSCPAWRRAERARDLEREVRAACGRWQATGRPRRQAGRRDRGGRLSLLSSELLAGASARPSARRRQTSSRDTTTPRSYRRAAVGRASWPAWPARRQAARAFYAFEIARAAVRAARPRRPQSPSWRAEARRHVDAEADGPGGAAGRRGQAADGGAAARPGGGAEARPGRPGRRGGSCRSRAGSGADARQARGSQGQAANLRRDVETGIARLADLRSRLGELGARRGSRGELDTEAEVTALGPDRRGRRPAGGGDRRAAEHEGGGGARDRGRVRLPSGWRHWRRLGRWTQRSSGDGLPPAQRAARPRSRLLVTGIEAGYERAVAADRVARGGRGS